MRDELLALESIDDKRHSEKPNAFKTSSKNQRSIDSFKAAYITGIGE